MKYAFVFISIVAIWLAVIIMAVVVPSFQPRLAHLLALTMTLILFVIGFRRI